MNRLGFLLGLVLPIWASLGIAQTDFWRQTNGPFGGSVYAIHVSTNGDVYAGTYGGGVFRSINGGDNWIGVNNGVGKNRYLRSLAANSSGHIFAGTDGGIFRSTNAGENWSEINFGLTSRSTYALAVTVSGTLFAGTDGGGVFRSTDNGDNWVHASSGLASNAIRSLVIDRSGRILAGTQGYGIYRSTNNGDSWSLVGLMNVTVLSLAIDSTGTLFAGTALGGVYRSTNDGVSWSSVCLSGNNVYALAVNPSGYVFAGFPGIYRSVDGGGYWYAAGTLSNSVYCISINRSNGNIYAGTVEGVYRSTDNGASWTPVNTGLAATDARAVASNAQGVLYAAVDGGMFRTVDNGANWVQVNNGLTDRSPLSLLILPNNQVFVGSYAGVFRSTDNGESWLRFYTDLPSYKPVNCLARDQSGHILAATGEGIFRSTDGAEHWSSISTGLASTDVRSIIVNTYGHLFACTAGGGVFRSTNNGGSWTAVNTGLTTDMIQSLAVNSLGYIFAGTQSKGVFRSTDNGTSWTPMSSGLPLSAYIHSLAMNSSGFIFACTFDGVFRSTDDGTNWSSINSGLTNNYVRAIAFNSSGVAFAATGGNGVCRSVGSTFAPRIALDKASFSFAADSGFSLPSTQVLTISNSGGWTLNWAATTNSAWLNVTPTNGSLAEGESTFVNVGMNTTALVPGTYLDTVTISCASADNSPQRTPVTYHMQALPRIAVTAQSIAFAADSGASRPEQTLTISNTGVGTLRWKIVKKETWLTVTPDSGLSNSASVLVKVGSTDMLPGIYRDTLRITGVKAESGADALNSPLSVPLTYTVNAVTQLKLNTWSLTFTADSGAGIPPTQVLVVSNPGVGTLQWVATKKQPWINISPDGGTGNSSLVTIGILNANLSPAIYRDTIEIAGRKAGTSQLVPRSPQRVAVSYVVGARAILSINKSSVDFGADSGAVAPPEQSILLTNLGAGTLRWTCVKKQSWLGVNPAADSCTSSAIAVKIIDTRLAPGAYTDTLVISGTKKETGSEALGSPICTVVSFTVGARARLVVDKSSLAFAADSGGVLPDSARLAVTNAGAGTLRWSMSKTQGWVKLSQDSDTTNIMTVHIWVLSTNLPPGIYVDTLMILADKLETGSSAVSSPLHVPLSYRVYALPKILLSAQELRFVADSGNVLPSVQKFVVSNAGEKTLQWSARKKQSWLDLSRAIGSSNSDTLAVSVNTTSLSAAVYSDTISISSPNAVNSPQQIKVVYRVIINHLPLRFMMVRALKQDTLALTAPPKPLDFSWRASSDADPGDSVRYTLRVTGPGLDTVVGGLKDTTVSLDVMNKLRVGSSYRCWVTATDGWATVSSDTLTIVTSSRVTGVDDEVTVLPNSFDLFQNYPNPFNPSTTVTFSLPYASLVSLRVYNLLGQEVAVLVNEQLGAGMHARVFAAGNLSSGVYLYKLTAGEASTGSAHSFVQTRGMVLTK